MNSPATILSASIAVPETVVTSAEVKEYFPKAFHLDARRLAGIYSVIDHARISRRHMLFPLDYVITPRPLEKISCEYKTHAIQLGRQAAEDALQQAGLPPSGIDLIITVSCTGLMIPPLEAHLVNLMGFRSDVKRIPINALGCSAGAAGLARAADFLQAFPDANVLLIAVELPSLTFQRDDPSPGNLISCCLFGDGAAAVVLTSRRQPGLQILDSRSHLFPGTTHAMGFDLKSSGLHVILSKEVPQLIKDNIRCVTETLLARHGLSLSDLEFFLFHPGGQKLLSFVEEELGIGPASTASSWKVLDEYGNLSSATVLFVIREFLSQPPPPPGAKGLLAGFGPGFSADLCLLQWT